MRAPLPRQPLQLGPHERDPRAPRLVAGDEGLHLKLIDAQDGLHVDGVTLDSASEKRLQQDALGRDARVKRQPVVVPHAPSPSPPRRLRRWGAAFKRSLAPPIVGALAQISIALVVCIVTHHPLIAVLVAVLGIWLVMVMVADGLRDLGPEADRT